MGRPAGSRSEDYEEKRQALAEHVLQALLADANASLSALAEAAGVSRPTLLHYFGDREGAVQAALALSENNARPYLDVLVSLPVDDPGAALRQALTMVIQGWRDYGVGNLHQTGLLAGLQNPDTAATYLECSLDPLIDGVAALIQRLIDAGHLSHPSPRMAALQLLGPTILLLLHQRGLGGAHSRPLREEALAEQLVDGFLRGYAAR